MGQCGSFDLEKLKVKVKIRQPPRRLPHFSGFRIQGQGQDPGCPMDGFQGHRGRTAAASQGLIHFKGRALFKVRGPAAGFKVSPAFGPSAAPGCALPHHADALTSKSTLCCKTLQCHLASFPLPNFCSTAGYFSFCLRRIGGAKRRREIWPRIIYNIRI